MIFVFASYFLFVNAHYMFLLKSVIYAIF